MLKVLLVCILLYISGCATIDADIKLPDGTQAKIKTSSFAKDFAIDPNGVMSSVSPENKNIIDMFWSGLAGFATALILL